MTAAVKAISSKQRTLSVGLRDEATFANYFPHQNAELITELKRTASGAGEHVIYFHGTGGLGRTHLSQACCHHADQFKLPAIYLPFANLLAYTPDVLQGLEGLALVCVDDLHMIAGQRVWEEAFLYFYNRLMAAGGRLIITAKTAPKLLGIQLADVASRLTLSVVYQLQALSDEEKLATLIKRAELRGLILSEEVASFILTHCPRHMSTLFAALDALDKESLSSKRRPTIPFVKEVLEI
jgi:DnaA family protein